jgi:hypothetical protein
MLLPIQSGVNEMESRDVRGLSLRRPEFHFSSVHMGFAVDKVALRWVSLRVLQLYRCQCQPANATYSCVIHPRYKNVATDTLREGDVKKLSGLFLQWHTLHCRVPAAKYTVCESHGTWHMTKLFYKEM